LALVWDKTQCSVSYPTLVSRADETLSMPKIKLYGLSLLA